MTMATLAVIVFVATKSIKKNTQTATSIGLPEYTAPFLASAVNAITITVLNVIYHRVAMILTEWENHRTIG